MSYLVSLVVIKQDDGTYKWGHIGSFGGLHWSMNKDDKIFIEKLNTKVIKEFKEKNTLGLTTLDKLLTAPVDEIIVIDNKENWHHLEDRKPCHLKEGEWENLSKILDETLIL